jgi:hypothetical protein
MILYALGYWLIKGESKDRCYQIGTIIGIAIMAITVICAYGGKP